MPRFRMFPLMANNVLSLYQQRELIDLEPPYQRLAVWDEAKRQRFIDSVINGVDTPKFYFHELQSSSDSSSRYKYSVIDGKQRLMSLWQFIEDKLPLPSDFTFFDNEDYDARGLTYRELLSQYPLLRARFDDYELPVVLVQSETEEFIEQLFSRLNIQVPLSAAEQRNALGGPLPLLIRRVGLSPFFRESVRFPNNRLQHFDLAAKFLYISLSQAFVSTKKVNLDNFVRSMHKAKEEGDDAASNEVLSALESSVSQELDRMYRHFGSNSALLTSSGRTTLYYHVSRICTHRGIRMPVELTMIERFNADLTLARKKSQRMSFGSEEGLSEMEEELMLFDREKQSMNDANGVKRQYTIFRSYMRTTFGIDLPVDE